MESIRRLTHSQLLIGTAALTVVGLAFAYLLDVTGNDDSGSDVAGFVIDALVALAIAAFLVLWLVPREEAQSGSHRPARTSLILGVLAFITLVGFWSGLPFVLGAPALYLGALGQARARGRVATTSGEAGVRSSAETPSEHTGGGEALAGTVLGAAALTIGLLLCIVA